ncbi:hypothetical protein ACWDRB_66580, partial [Nonomuraea sp. NPDC003707]
PYAAAAAGAPRRAAGLLDDVQQAGGRPDPMRTAARQGAAKNATMAMPFPAPHTESAASSGHGFGPELAA